MAFVSNGISGDHRIHGMRVALSRKPWVVEKNVVRRVVTSCLMANAADVDEEAPKVVKVGELGKNGSFRNCFR